MGRARAKSLDEVGRRLEDFVARGGRCILVVVKVFGEQSISKIKNESSKKK